MHCKLLRNNSFVTNMAGPGSHIDLFLFPRSNLAILNKTAGIRALFGKQQHMDCSQETQTHCMHGLSSKILVNQDMVWKSLAISYGKVLL